MDRGSKYYRTVHGEPDVTKRQGTENIAYGDEDVSRSCAEKLSL